MADTRYTLLGLLWCSTFALISLASLIHAITVWDALGSLFSLALFSMSGIYTGWKAVKRYVKRKTNDAIQRRIGAGRAIRPM